MFPDDNIRPENVYNDWTTAETGLPFQLHADVSTQAYSKTRRRDHSENNMIRIFEGSQPQEAERRTRAVQKSTIAPAGITFLSRDDVSARTGQTIAEPGENVLSAHSWGSPGERSTRCCLKNDFKHIYQDSKVQITQPSPGRTCGGASAFGRATEERRNVAQCVADQGCLRCPLVRAARIEAGYPIQELNSDGQTHLAGRPDWPKSVISETLKAIPTRETKALRDRPVLSWTVQSQLKAQ